MLPGTPMADLFPLGQAAFGNRRRPDPPPGFGPRHLETAFEKILRRVLGRCLAVGFGGRKGSEKGSEKGS